MTAASTVPSHCLGDDPVSNSVPDTDPALALVLILFLILFQTLILL